MTTDEVEEHLQIQLVQKDVAIAAMTMGEEETTGTDEEMTEEEGGFQEHRE
jgi:hypothetical protein